jgi:enolase-phosphatase E1
MVLPAGVRGVLLDIEGTTTPIRFVYETLFPYAAARLDAVCADAGSAPAVAAAIELLRAEHAGEPAEIAAAGGAPLPPFGDGAAYAHRLMAEDRKSTGLKALQGLIWQGGYQRGELVSELFADVPAALAAWRAAGLRLRIFSSGSRQAQVLLFAHTAEGDLTPRFDGFHDTTTGSKREAESYRRIAADFALPPAALLFLSDVVGELDAAAAAGYATGLVVRPGNPPQPATSHSVYRSFGELLPAAAAAAGAASSATQGVA